MKKIVTTILAILVCVSFSLSMGCSPTSTHTQHVWESTYTYDGTKHVRSCTVSGCNVKDEIVDHVFGDYTIEEGYHYQKCTIEGCEEISQKVPHQMEGHYCIEDMVMHRIVKCSVCDYKDYSADSPLEIDILVKPSDSNKSQIINGAKSGDVVAFAKGVYSSFEGKMYQENITYIAETGTSISVINCAEKSATYENFTITGLSKEVGFNFNYTTSGVTIKNCRFTAFGGIYARYNSSDTKIINNLTVENCVFKDVGVSSDADNASAIVLTHYNGLTIKDCVFDTVEYNAMQVGEHANGGEVLITGNVFKDMGSRVVYLVNVNNLTSCEISDNIFYDHHDNYSATGDGGVKKDSGVYIHTRSTSGALHIGTNKWVNIPADDAKYIAPFADYHVLLQLLYIVD